MPTQATPHPHEITATVDSRFNMLEMPWRAWGDPESLGTFYQLGYDAWRNWAEMQLSLLDACWKMGCLTLDVPGDKSAGKAASEGRTEVKLKKISNG